MGENIVTHTRTRDPRTREPARVVTPVIITTRTRPRDPVPANPHGFSYL